MRKLGWRFIYPSGLVLSFLALSLLLVQPFLSPLQAEGAVNQNPSFAEISQIIEEVALEKDIPSAILKAIAYKESGWRQYDSQGNPLLAGASSHPSIGIMQVSSYDGSDTDTVQRLKYEPAFNIRMGADILNQKWATVPQIGDGDRNKLENWYLALWAYNSWSSRNNPNQQAPGATYQDKVLAIMADPASKDARLIPYLQPVRVTALPASSLPATGVPARGSVWATPQPIHWGDVVDFSYPEMERLAGNDRIDTAIQQARTGWPDGNQTVILARADDFPDALAGVPLAGYFDAPILLTSANGLDQRVAEELKRLQPEQIYLLGGEGALSPEVSSALSDLGWDESRQIRLGGKDRYGTAENIALTLASLSTAAELSVTAGTGEPGVTIASGGSVDTGGSVTASSGAVDSVVLATGQNFPDALSVASAAGRDTMPILLTTKNTISESTLAVLTQLNPTQVYIIGGEGVISEEVAQKVSSTLGLPESSIIRLGGSNRYSTAAKVAEHFSQPLTTIHFATGENFPDALSGAALAVHQQSQLILLPPTSLDTYPELQAYLEKNWSSLSKVSLLGGSGAITDGRTRELWSLGD